MLEYTLADLDKLTWQGDETEQIERFMTTWAGVIEYMGCTTDKRQLQRPLAREMAKSKNQAILYAMNKYHENMNMGGRQRLLLL